MKRSEMHNIIFEAFCKPVAYNDDGGLQLIWQTENVLKAIEEAGMLPPEHSWTDENGDYHSVLKWESEDK